MRRRMLPVAVLAMLAVLLGAVPAAADHTNPRQRLSSTEDPGTTELLTEGSGTWKHIRNFPPNPGTDVKLFRKRGRLYAAAGTLGQANGQHVGQRIIRLTNRKGKVRPRWVADHGSANCPTANPAGTTGLQHDQILVPKRNPKFLIDTTDATGRCHDPDGGGLEIVNVSRIHKKKFKPREVHLTRHAGTSHTVTLDDRRPWIVYNNSSQSSGMPWIDVLNIKSCLRKRVRGMKEMRQKCRPKVYRIYLKDRWTRRIDGSGDPVEGSESACHDITSKGGRLYCANLNSTIVLNVSRLSRPGKKRIRGEPLKCKVVPGTNTGAKVTDCDDLEAVGNGQARGWRYVGHVNHPGRNGSHNTNTEYESTEGVAVSHEAEPTPNKKFMFVTDERGGGVVPIGASCPGTPNPYGNGGVHVFRIGRGGEYKYARDPDGNKAVFIGDVVVPSPDFCTAHVMEQFRGEHRFSIAWYSQGTKIVDWFVNNNNRFIFQEEASAVPQGPPAQTWTSIVFKRKKLKNGRRAYWFISSDISRGIDIMKWVGKPNRPGTPPPRPASLSNTSPMGDRTGESPLGVFAAGLLAVILLAPLASRRRFRVGRSS